MSEPTTKEPDKRDVQLATMQKQIDALIAGGARAQQIPNIPVREPKGKADWFVAARHTPLLPEAKRAIVQATGREDAWKQFLDRATELTTLQKFIGRADGGAANVADGDTMAMRKLALQRHADAVKWIAEAKKKPVPDDAEIMGNEYHSTRRAAMRIKGTVSKEQIGFEELASV